MEIIIHRINKIKELKKIPINFGTEIDIRSNNSQLILSHDPFLKGDKLINYLENYKHKTLVLNLKEAGIEKTVLNIVKKYSIKSYFLLDVEMPYMYTATKGGQKNIAVRFSEYEDIALADHFKDKLKWVWIDTATKLPLNQDNIKTLSKFKSCLVCPERWGRVKDIVKYKKILKKLNYKPDAVMTSKKCLTNWLS
tara:strand:- start:185 stop:769 length:585 start_codon:yes stop_codon:yes gene_type:complete